MKNLLVRHDFIAFFYFITAPFAFLPFILIKANFQGCNFTFPALNSSQTIKTNYHVFYHNNLLFSYI